MTTADTRATARAAFPDWRFAPNQGGNPDVYEIENRGIDPDGHVLAATRRPDAAAELRAAESA